MIWVILFLGLLLRVIHLDQSLWLDEAINVLATQKFSLLGMVTEYAKADFHPPGFFIILWLWTRLFGFSEIAVRLPSVIFGSFTIWVVYLIGKKLVSKEIAIISALLLSINPLHIYYSQEARMYSLAAFVVALNFYFFLGVLANPPRAAGIAFGDAWPRWTVAFSNLLVLLSDYLAYLIFPAQFIFIMLTKKAKVLKFFVISLIVALISFSWWIPIFLEQLNIGQSNILSVPGWKMVVGEGGIKPLILTYVKFIIGRISHPDLSTYVSAFLPIGLLYLFLSFRGIKFADKLTKKLLLAWLILPTMFAFLISLVIPVYSYFRLLFVLPAFLILIAIGVSSFKWKVRILWIGFLVIIEIIASLIYLFNPAFQREDWKGLVQYLKQKPSNSKILFESNGSFAPFDYYAKDSIKGMGALKKFPAKTGNDLLDLQSVLYPSKEIFLIDYLVEISDSNRLVAAKLRSLGYQEVDIKNFNGVGFVYHFVKNE